MKMMYIQVRLNIPRNVYLTSKRRCFVVNFSAGLDLQNQYCNFGKIRTQAVKSNSTILREKFRCNGDFEGVNQMGSISKTLKKAKFRGSMTGSLFLQTYRESNKMILSKDEVVVLLPRNLFPDGNMPAEVNVTVSWNEKKEIENALREGLP